MKNFCSRRVLVTGGAIRVGAVIARAFADAGATVIVHCRRSRKEAEELLASFPGTGHQIVCGDLTEAGVPERIIAESLPDILINNASAYVRASFRSESHEAVQEMLKINFLAPLAMMKAFAASVSENISDPVIINMVDQAISGSMPGGFGYLASKKALADATETAAAEYAPRIRVNAVAPGPVMAPPGLEHLNMQTTLQKVPLGRPVPPEDIAQSILFLAACSSVTGTILYVDGGQHLNIK